MLKETTLKPGDEFTLPIGRTVALQTIQSNMDKPLYLIKSENKADSVITEFSNNEVILSNTFKISSDLKLKILTKEGVEYENDTNVTLKYLLTEAVHNNGSQNNIEIKSFNKDDAYFNLDDVEEDEEYDEAAAEEQELYEDEEYEEADDFGEESDIEDIAHDLWEECANEFGEDKNKFLGKKRK
jgi:hypothetical protein